METWPWNGNLMWRSNVKRSISLNSIIKCPWFLNVHDVQMSKISDCPWSPNVHDIQMSIISKCIWCGNIYHMSQLSQVVTFITCCHTCHKNWQLRSDDETRIVTHSQVVSFFKCTLSNMEPVGPARSRPVSQNCCFWFRFGAGNNTFRSLVSWRVKIVSSPIIFPLQLLKVHF